MKFCIAIIARALVTISTNRAGGSMFASAADQDLLAGHPYIDKKPDANAGATTGGSELVRTVSKNDSIRSMIIGGDKVGGLDYPFMARFESENNFVCGGSLIAPCVLLTAAHCTNVKKGTEVKLGLFEVVNNPPPGKGETFVVDEVATPKDSDLEEGVGSDLKLVKIYGESKATPVDLDVVDGRCIPPCFDSTFREENLDVTIPGWGSRDITQPFAFSDDLYKLDTKLTSPAACDMNIDKNFEFQGLDSDQMICTKTEGATTFSGDSGGPLIIKGTNSQIGVLYGAPTNFGNLDPVEALTIASVYTNLRQADLLWINDYLIEWEDCNCTMEPSDQPSEQPSDHPSPYPSPSGPSESMQPSDQPSPNPSPSGPSESMQPSDHPSPNPSPSGPSESPKPSMSPTCHPSSTGHACGDPHFKTFDEHLFSYHGQCDLLLTRSDSFAHGLGLHVHIRTTRVSSPHMDYSYISGIAVKIGPDTLEVSGDGKLIVNGHSTVFPEFTDNIAFARTVYTLTKTLMGDKQRIVAYNLDLGEDIDSSIQIRVNTKKSMLFVDMNGAFADSEGLLGAALEEGKPLFARDGITDLTGHWNTYGEEWQVNDTDPKLFQDSHRHPQYPVGCLYTTTAEKNMATMSHVRRRLEDTGITHIVGLQEASKACSHLDDDRMKDFCVNDVMATGDIDLVEDPFYANA